MDNNSNQDRGPISSQENVHHQTANSTEDQEYVHLKNANSTDRSIYDRLSDPRFDPESAKIVEEAKIGTLDDNVDITDPDYDETKTQDIESELSSGHYRP